MCVSTAYLVTSLEALGLHSTGSVWVDCDARLLLGSKDVVNLANEHFVLSPDHTSEQGNCVTLDHANDLALADVGNLSDDVQSLRGSAIVATAYSNQS